MRAFAPIGFAHCILFLVTGGDVQLTNRASDPFELAHTFSQFAWLVRHNDRSEFVDLNQSP